MFKSIISIIKNDNETNAMSASRILIDIIKHFNSSLSLEKHTVPLYQFLEERISKMMVLIQKNMNNKDSKENIQNPQRLTPNSESLKVLKNFSFFMIKNLKNTLSIYAKFLICIFMPWTILTLRTRASWRII